MSDHLACVVEGWHAVSVDARRPCLGLRLVLAFRAERYRVFKRIVGVDAEPVEVANAVTESEFTLTGLPSGQTVIVTIVPVNDAGDGPTSDGTQTVLP